MLDTDQSNTKQVRILVDERKAGLGGRLAFDISRGRHIDRWILTSKCMNVYAARQDESIRRPIPFYSRLNTEYLLRVSSACVPS